MFKTSYRTLACTAMLFLAQGCTTAIIDEAALGDLPPITRTVTYQSDVKSILDNYCTTCHGGSAPQSGLDLTTFENARAIAGDGSLSLRINSLTDPMPPSGRLTPQIRQLIEKWIEDGSLEKQ